jgi:RNA polymerase sigma-70 factor (ECF subfamily)
MSLDDEGRQAAQETQWISRIASGDVEEPMRELYRRYARNLWRFGRHMLADDGLAEEMVQQTFERLWRGAGQFDPARGSPAAYLFVIARSVTADIRKRPSSRQMLPLEDFQLPPLPDTADQILDSVLLRQALDKLSAPHAQVLRLALEEDLTQSQIAERLGVPLGTVKTRTFHALRTLRSALTERGSDAA